VNAPGRSRLRLALAVYAVAVLAAAAAPSSAVDAVAPDKVLHLGAYGALTLLALFAGVPAGWGVAGAVGLSVAHGAVVELFQAFLPWRRAEWGDLGADGLGALAAAILWVGASRWRRAGGDSSPREKGTR
jgi:VanZ family protein